MKIVLSIVSLTSCVVRTTGPIASEHAAQTQIVADRCRETAGGYTDAPCSSKLQADLDAMSAQAACIDAIMRGKACDGR
jgi:hypothetical protein